MMAARSRPLSIRDVALNSGAITRGWNRRPLTMHRVDNLLVRQKCAAFVPVRVGFVKQPFARFVGQERLPYVDDHSSIQRRREHLVGPRDWRELEDSVVEVLRIDYRLVGRNRKHVRDPMRPAPVARAEDRLTPVFNLSGRQRILIRVVVQPRILGVVQPALFSPHDLRRGRDVQPVIPRLAVPPHERGSEAEMILEPLVEAVRPAQDRLPRAFQLRKPGQVAVLGLLVAAVLARDVGGQRESR